MAVAIVVIAFIAIAVMLTIILIIIPVVMAFRTMPFQLPAYLAVDVIAAPCGRGINPIGRVDVDVERIGM